MPGASKPFPGLDTCLDRLHAEGFRLAVCTNKSAQLAVPLLEKLGWLIALPPSRRRYLCLPQARWPAPAGNNRTADGTASNSILVGDSVNDIQAAKNAGVASLGVTFGYSDVPIADLNPPHHQPFQ